MEHSVGDVVDAAVQSYKAALDGLVEPVARHCLYVGPRIAVSVVCTADAAPHVCVLRTTESNVTRLSQAN